MTRMMRCPFCGLLQDEPTGVKSCLRCGGELEFEQNQISGGKFTYIQSQMELDQIAAPTGRNTERFLLLTITTPSKVPDDEATPVGKARTPMNFAPVLDISGSMAGGKLTQAKKAITQALNHLHEGDFFSLVTFSNEIECPIEPVQIEFNVIDGIREALTGIHQKGMTNLAGGLEEGIRKIRENVQETNLILLLSDGLTNVGETDLEKIGYIAYQARQKDLTVSTIGIGRNYNEALMVEISNQGGGRFYHLEDENLITSYVAGELGEAANLAARDTKILLDIPEGATLVPLTAAYPIVQNGNIAEVTIGDIPCETELEIPLRLALLPQNKGVKLSVKGSLQFESPAGNSHKQTINRVTIRFTDQSVFNHREGVVMPVAEKVFVQLKAASLLKVNRAKFHKPEEMEKEASDTLEGLQHYSEKLGKDRSVKEMRRINRDYDDLKDPYLSKRATHIAHSAQRGSKNFDKR